MNPKFTGYLEFLGLHSLQKLYECVAQATVVNGLASVHCVEKVYNQLRLVLSVEKDSRVLTSGQWRWGPRVGCWAISRDMSPFPGGHRE